MFFFFHSLRRNINDYLVASKALCWATSIQFDSIIIWFAKCQCKRVTINNVYWTKINCSQKVRKLFSIQYICHYLILSLYMVYIIVKLNCSSLKWYHSCNDYMLLDLTTLMRMRQSHKSNVPKFDFFFVTVWTIKLTL